MPFIGQEPITGAFHKLDAITTSATDTYDLELNGGAYSPASANHLMVSLNGVIQAPQDSFTVSGSQIIFDSALTPSDSIDFIMALGDVLNVGTPTDGSVNAGKIANGAVTSAKLDTNIAVSGNLDVGTIRSASGNSALTIDSSGRVTLPNTVQIDNWRLTSAFSTNAATVTGWEQPDGTTSVTVGTSMTESSGIFTFPNTGVWKITGCIVFQLDNDAQGGVWFEVSTDSGSSYERMAGSFESATTHSTGNQGFTNQILVNVTNAGTTRFRLYTHSLGNNSEITASSNLNYTNLMFERITDAQV